MRTTHGRMILFPWARPLALLLLAACGDCGLDLGCDGSGAPSSEGEARARPEGEAAADATAPSIDPDERACARMILVAWEGARGAASDLARSKAEARQRSEQLLQRLRSEGMPFGTLAKAESDYARSTAGAVGTHAYGKWPKSHTQIRDVVFSLSAGEVAGPIETDRGYALVQRCSDEKVRVQHIMIRYQGAFLAGKAVERSRDEARRLAESLLVRIREGGQDMGRLAREHDESPEAGEPVDLDGSTAAPELEQVAFSLAPGQVSDVVESRYGFHLFKRLESGGAGDR